MHMTREEFGLDLFEAIKCIGGLIGVQDQYNAAVHKDDTMKLGELLKRRAALKAELIPLMKRLDASDVQQIVTRYPFVAKL